jgi:broad specificity phosphatase PhoE
MKLVLVRHSETKKNIEKRFDILSDTDETFTDFGHFQLEVTTKYIQSLTKVSKTLIISGPRKRVVDTSNYLSAKLELPHLILNNLSPIYSGNLAGISQKEAWEEYPELMEKRRLFAQNKIDGYEIVFPNGDNVRDYEIKIKTSLLKELEKLFDYDRIMFVTHRSIIVATLNIFSKLFGLQNEDTYRFFETPVGSIDMIIIHSKDFHKGKIIRKGGYNDWKNETK